MKQPHNWKNQRTRASHRREAARKSEWKRRWGKRFDDYYDPKGRPIDLMRWAGLAYKDPPSSIRRRPSRFKRVNATMTRGQHWVSTVWLGMDHSFGMSGPPVIFESMVFCHHDDAEAIRRRNSFRILNVDPEKIGEFRGEYEQFECDLDNEMDRYCTLKQARKGHWRMVNHVRHWEKEKRSGGSTDAREI